MKYIIFGESHGPAIGVTIENPPPGLVLDWDFINTEMARRAPGKSPLATPRKEADAVEILSGVYEGRTTGTPLCAVIRNTDTRSGDYSQMADLPRPGHGDFAGHVRYEGYNDVRGGGHFSGRLTAPLVFAGALAKLILREKGIQVRSEISNIAGAANPAPETIARLISEAAADGDSVGGAIRCRISGVSAGLGAPDFGRNAEGIIAQYLFAVPAIKALSFGAGYDFAAMRGSQANDPFYMDGDRVKTRTNHAGGINGGITNGMPIEFEVVFRPTPSIAKAQDTVSLSEKKDAKLEITGRHDPCIVPRAQVAVEAAAALAVCELMGI